MLKGLELFSIEQDTKKQFITSLINMSVSNGQYLVDIQKTCKPIFEMCDYFHNYPIYDKSLSFAHMLDCPVTEEEFEENITAFDACMDRIILNFPEDITRAVAAKCVPDASNYRFPTQEELFEIEDYWNMKILSSLNAFLESSFELFFRNDINLRSYKQHLLDREKMELAAAREAEQGEEWSEEDMAAVESYFKEHPIDYFTGEENEESNEVTDLQTDVTPQPQRQEPALPDELKPILDKAIEAGFVDKTPTGYKWKGTAALYGYFVDKVSDKLKMKPSNSNIPWRMFTPIFENIDTKKINAAKQAVVKYTKEYADKPEGSNRIDSILE